MLKGDRDEMWEGVKELLISIQAFSRVLRQNFLNLITIINVDWGWK